MPQIEVTFDIDANGILHVSAKDLGTGKEQKITITASSGLPKDEVEKMRKDAEAHADEDKKRKEEIEARNECDSSIYRSEKLLKEFGSKMSGGDKSKIEEAVKQAKEAINGPDAASIRSATERLNEAWQKVSTEMYKSASASGGPGGPRPGAGQAGPGGDAAKQDEGPIIDAEVVDERKGK
jgi:molecular chaperone DnaK